MTADSQKSLGQILAQFRDDARNNRDLGDRFERMMQQFFRVDPLYSGLFSDVWVWNEWPLKGQVGDVGIDLVARHKATGEYWAIQCKFYLPEHTLSKGDIDSFFTALGKPLFSKGIIVSTTDKWGKNALDALNQTKSVSRIGISDLEQSPIDWSKFDTLTVVFSTYQSIEAVSEAQKAGLPGVRSHHLRRSPPHHRCHA
jgi:predicted helicase